MGGGEETKSRKVAEKAIKTKIKLLYQQHRNGILLRSKGTELRLNQ